MRDLNFNSLETSLGVIFSDKNLLKQALTHRSYLNENESEGLESNERLEFLGDAILQFLTSEFIYKKYPNFLEGELTNLRSKLVNTESLAHESARLKLSDYLFLSRGEQETASESSYILANVFEAILGAIFLDKNLQACEDFLAEQLFYKTNNIVQTGELKDPKSLYQELAQEKYNTTPMYKVLEDKGPDHDKTFTVGVYLENKLVAKGVGSSKRRAQQDAAKTALEKEE